jgi:transcriptional regulator with XRE-family HTH domain
MAESTPDLLTQLSSRVRSFLAATGLSQRKLAKMIKTDEAHLANFLAGRSGLSAEKSLKLMQILNSTRSQLEAKFARKAVTSRILELQESGQPMKLDASGSWVAKEGGDWGSDPNNSTSIDNTPTARDLPGADDYQQRTIDFLKDQQNIYRKAIAEIDSYLNKVQKARPNANGSTESPRTVTTNVRSSTPGPKPDLFAKQERLEWLKAEREKTEQAIKLEKDLDREQAAYWAKRVELLRLKEK